MDNRLYTLSTKHLIKYLISHSKHLGWLEGEHCLSEADKIKLMKQEIAEIEEILQGRMK